MPIKKKNIASKKNDSELLQVKLENVGLKNQLELLRAELTSSKASPLVPIDIYIGDPEPIDQEKRIVYVGEVARLHNDILKPKLLKMIHSTHLLLESTVNPPDQDMALKGTVYALRELIRWGDLLSSEYKSYTPEQQKPPPQPIELPAEE